jgi:hypothetical protein
MESSSSTSNKRPRADSCVVPSAIARGARVTIRLPLLAHIRLSPAWAARDVTSARRLTHAA